MTQYDELVKRLRAHMPVMGVTYTEEWDGYTIPIQIEAASAITRLIADLASALEALKDANSKLRSAYQIAARQGVETNWSVFADRVMESLKLQQAIFLKARLQPIFDDSKFKTAIDADGVVEVEAGGEKQ